MTEFKQVILRNYENIKINIFRNTRSYFLFMQRPFIVFIADIVTKKKTKKKRLTCWEKTDSDVSYM